MKFINENPNSLYQNVYRAFGDIRKNSAPSKKTIDAVMVLVERVEHLEKEIENLKK